MPSALEQIRGSRAIQEKLQGFFDTPEFDLAVRAVRELIGQPTEVYPPTADNAAIEHGRILGINSALTALLSTGTTFAQTDEARAAMQEAQKRVSLAAAGRRYAETR